jgi:peptide/nickel transport system substrate-binding protein
MAEANHWTRLQQRRSSRRQLLAGLTAGAGLTGLVLAGCATGRKSTSGGAPSSQGGSQATQGTPQTGGTYNTYLPRDPTNIDPQVVSNTPGEQIARMAMSRPFRFQTGTRSGPLPNLVDDGSIEGDLALSAESPDAITWTLKLRPDAKFQNIPPVNGHAVEAEDIKATYVRALKIPTNPSRGAMGMIDPNQIQTPDNHTVVFKLNYPYAPFNRTLTSPVYSWIFPREALAGSYDPGKTMIGSGPFMMTSYTPKVEFVMG